jgi:hypothetical protein
VHPSCSPILKENNVYTKCFTPSPLLSLALNVIPSAVTIVVTIRFGLLAMIASFVASDITVHFPVTTDLSTRYASSTLFAYAVVLADAHVPRRDSGAPARRRPGVECVGSPKLTQCYPDRI